MTNRDWLDNLITMGRVATGRGGGVARLHGRREGWGEIQDKVSLRVKMSFQAWLCSVQGRKVYFQWKYDGMLYLVNVLIFQWYFPVVFTILAILQCYKTSFPNTVKLTSCKGRKKTSILWFVFELDKNGRAMNKIINT